MAEAPTDEEDEPDYPDFEFLAPVPGMEEDEADRVWRLCVIDNRKEGDKREEAGEPRYVPQPMHETEQEGHL